MGFGQLKFNHYCYCITVLATEAFTSRISFQIENGADLCALNSAGKSAFYTSIKHAPNSFRSIEKRLDKGLILENPGSDSGPIIKMDFIAIVPR